ELGQARGVRGAVDVQLGDFSGTLVPARHQEAYVVEAVVVVEMSEEDVRDLHRLHAGLQHAVVGARSEVEQDLPVAGLDQVAGAHALQRRGGRAGAEESDAHIVCSLKCGGTADKRRYTRIKSRTISPWSTPSVCFRVFPW